MTCEGCGRQVELMDGHYCGQCLGQVAAAVQSAVDDLSVFDGEVYDVFVAKDDRLCVKLDRGVTDAPGE